MHAALYGRISTVDKDQDVKLQLRDLPMSATAHEWEISLEAMPEITDFPLELRLTLQAPWKEATTIAHSVEPVSSAPPGCGLLCGAGNPIALGAPTVSATVPAIRSSRDHSCEPAAGRPGQDLLAPTTITGRAQDGVARCRPPNTNGPAPSAGLFARYDRLTGTVTTGVPSRFPDPV
jgi:hypothetical protein